MAELDHRVKNTLSNVSAVAHLSSHRAASVGSVRAGARRADPSHVAGTRLVGARRLGRNGPARARNRGAETVSDPRQRQHPRRRRGGLGVARAHAIVSPDPARAGDECAQTWRPFHARWPRRHLLDLRRCRAAPTAAAGLARRGRSRGHTTDDARFWPHRSQGGGLRRRRAGRVSVRTEPASNTASRGPS